MNIILFERYGVPSTLLHAEIVQNVGPVWPSRLNFCEVFMLHLPVTRRLISHCIEAVSNEETEQLKLFPELLPYLESLDPKKLLEIDLKKIISIENALNPDGMTTWEQAWLTQMMDAADEFPNEVIVTKSGQIEIEVENEYANPMLRLTTREGFPNVAPTFEGAYEEVLSLQWTKTTTLSTIVTNFIELSTELTAIYAELVEFTEPNAFLRLVHPETRKTLRCGELHCIKFDSALPSCLIVPLCIVPICEDRDPVYIRIWIDTREPEEYPQKLEAPEEFYDVDKWDREETLNANLNNFFMKDKYDPNITDTTFTGF